MAETDVFFASGGGAQAMSHNMGVPFLGRVPLDPALSQAAEEGRSVFAPGGPALSSLPALRGVIDKIVRACGENPDEGGDHPNGDGTALSHGSAEGNEDGKMDPLLSARLHLGF